MRRFAPHIASPSGELWIYRGGSIGLGTSGSGDVLAGLIARLVAQGAALEQAPYGVSCCTGKPAARSRRRSAR